MLLLHSVFSEQQETRQGMEYTQEQLTELFIHAVNLFNETMNEKYKVGDDAA